jgi:hypothetical protein
MGCTASQNSIWTLYSHPDLHVYARGVARLMLNRSLGANNDSIPKQTGSTWTPDLPAQVQKLLLQRRNLSGLDYYLLDLSNGGILHCTHFIDIVRFQSVESFASIWVHGV